MSTGSWNKANGGDGGRCNPRKRRTRSAYSSFPGARACGPSPSFAPAARALLLVRSVRLVLPPRAGSARSLPARAWVPRWGLSARSALPWHFPGLARRVRFPRLRLPAQPPSRVPSSFAPRLSGVASPSRGIKEPPQVGALRVPQFRPPLEFRFQRLGGLIARARFRAPAWGRRRPPRFREAGGGVFAVFVSPLSPSLRVGGWCPASAFFRHVPGRVSSWPVLPSCRSFARPRTSRGRSGWGMGPSAQVPARVDHRVPGAWIALCGARRRRKIDEKDAAHALLSKYSKEVNGGDKKLTRADSRCYNVRATKSI